MSVETLPNPSLIPALFIRLNLTPVRKSFELFDSNDNLCGSCLSVALQLRSRNQPKPPTWRDYSRNQNGTSDSLGVSKRFVYGLIKGWDDNAIPCFDDPNEIDEAIAGFNYGAACRNACRYAGRMK